MNRAVLESAAGRSIRYLSELDGRRVRPTAEAVSALAQLDGGLPAAPSDPEAVLDRLDRLGSPATMASAGGRYFGFVIGGALPARSLPERVAWPCPVPPVSCLELD